MSTERSAGVRRPRHNHQGLALDSYVVGALDRETGLYRIYRGRSIIGSRFVEVKVLKPALLDYRATVGDACNPCIHELRLAGELDPRLVSRHVAAGSTVDGDHYLVREWSDVPTLRQRLTADGAFTFPVALGLALDGAEVLKAIHDRDHIYVDLRPANFALETDDDSGGLTARIRDLGTIMPGGFGERGLPPDYLQEPGYMSPEEADGQPLSGSADIYALGCLLYELLSGRPPLEVAPTTARAVIGYIAGGGRIPSARLRDLGVTVPPSVDLLVGKCLDRDPLNRPGSVDQFIRGLSHVFQVWCEANRGASVPPRLASRLGRR